MSGDFDKFLAGRQPGFEWFTISWHVDVMRLGRKKASLALCSKTGNVAFAATDLLHPLLIQNVHSDKIKQTCEDGYCCLDLTCSYNCADPKRMKHYGIRNRHDLETMHRRVEELKSKCGLESLEPRTQLLYKKPAVTVRKARNNDA